MGATPHRWAKAASLRSRSGLPPAVTSKQASRGDRAHTLDGQEFWGCLSHQLAQLRIERLDLGAELLVAPSKDLERKFGCRGWRGDERQPSAKGTGLCDKLRQTGSAQLAPQGIRGGDHQRVQLVGGLSPGLECRSPHGLHTADHLDRARRRFWGVRWLCQPVQRVRPLRHRWGLTSHCVGEFAVWDARPPPPRGRGHGASEPVLPHSSQYPRSQPGPASRIAPPSQPVTHSRLVWSQPNAYPGGDRVGPGQQPHGRRHACLPRPSRAHSACLVR
jgi:hypothetical protein